MLNVLTLLKALKTQFAYITQNDHKEQNVQSNQFDISAQIVQHDHS